MIEALNTKAAMILAGALAVLALVFGGIVLVMYGQLLATLFVLGLIMFSALGWKALNVKIERGRHAKEVVRDKPDSPVRIYDGKVIPYPLFPNLTTYHGPVDRSSIETPAIAAPVVDATPSLPIAKSIYELASAMHDADKVLLGYDEHGPIWLEIDDLLSIAMAGNAGRGKSRALLWLALQFYRLQLDTRVIDGKADLRKWLGAYQPVAYTPAEIKQVVDGTIDLIEARLDEDSRGLGTEFPPVLVILDELDLITGRYERVTKLVELLTKKSRSVNVHGVYSNQSIPAGLVGGIKNRGVIVSRICFYCDDEAAQLIGVRERNGGSELLQRIGPPAPQGLALVRTAIFGWRLVAFPFVPDTAISFLLDGLPPLPPMPMKANRVCVQEDEPAKTDKNITNTITHTLTHKAAQVTPEQRHYILDQTAAGKSPSAIAVMLWNDAHKNVVVRQVIEEEESV